MAASPLLGLNLQLPGTSINLWGQILNDQVFTLTEEAIAGLSAIPLTGNLTLTSTSFVTNQARKAVLVLTAGSGLVAAPTVTVPNKQKLWLVVNNTGFAVTFNCGGVPATLPIGRTGFIICDGVDLIKFDPVTDAIAGVSGIAAAAAVSAAAAAASAGAASTSATNAGSSASSSAGFASASAGYRDQSQGFANASAASAAAAAASAAGVNLPPVNIADAGKALVVKSDGTGYAPLLISSPAMLTPSLTSPASGATDVFTAGTYTFVARAFVGDTTGFYSNYGVAVASRFVAVYEPGGTVPVYTFTASGGGPTLVATLAGSGLAYSHAYQFEFGYIDAQGNTVRSPKVTATTVAAPPPVSIGVADGGGFRAFESFGDGLLYNLVVAAKSTETSKTWNSGNLVGTFSRLSGPTNTTAVNTYEGGTAAYAPCYAEALTSGSQTDWYLGAIDELRAIAFKLKPTAAPVAAFQTGGAEVFPAGSNYWSSTESDASNALNKSMTTEADGGPDAKSATRLVRAIRRYTVTPPYPIGTAMEGGYLAAYFTDMSSGSPVTYMLIVADKATETLKTWGPSGALGGVTASRTNGVAATALESASAAGSAGDYCQQLVSGTKTDWYLGAIDELLAVGRMNASLPSGQQLFAGAGFWSSTEVDSSQAKRMQMGTTPVSEDAGGKTSTAYVRPIRRVAI